MRATTCSVSGGPPDPGQGRQTRGHDRPAHGCAADGGASRPGAGRGEFFLFDVWQCSPSRLRILSPTCENGDSSFNTWGLSPFFVYHWSSLRGIVILDGNSSPSLPVPPAFRKCHPLARLDL